MRGTPNRIFASLGPILGCARPFQAGIFLSVLVFARQKASEIKGSARLEDGSVLAMIIFASRVFVHPRDAKQHQTGSWSNDCSCA
jgi:hypothetical protein